MKRVKKLLAVALSAVCAFGVCMLGGCSPKVSNTEQTLEVFATNAGYGVDWLTAGLNAFKEEQWVKDKYPELIIPALKEDSVTDVFAKISGGDGNSNTVDLYVTCAPMGSFVVGASAKFAELTDVYDSVIPGESKTVGEKMSAGVREPQEIRQVGVSEDAPPEYYGMPWVRGAMGMFYNKTRLDALMGVTDYETPRTTDRLVSLVADLQHKINPTDPTAIKDAPMLYMSNSSYTGATAITWWAQYEGIENYENFWYGIDEDGNYSSDVFRQQGRLEALTVLERLIGRQHYQSCAVSMTGSHMEIQTKFMTGEAGVFFFNGDWLLNEMKNLNKSDRYHVDDVRMLRMPVISAIVDKCSSVKTDDQLNEVVGYVDKNMTFDAAKTEYAKNNTAELVKADYDRIYSARNMVQRMGGHEMFIPEYALGKEVAKDFMRFMASDKGIEILVREGKGFISPFDFDAPESLKNEFSPMQRERYERMKTAVELRASGSYPLYQFGGLKAFTRTANIDRAFGAENADDRKSAYEVYKEDIDYYTGNNDAQFNLLLEKAGLR